MKNLILMVLIIGLVGCDDDYPLMTDGEVTEAKKRELRQWRETKTGVSYFTTCAEGMLFIATRSTHSLIQLAGPIGECTEGDN